MDPYVMLDDCGDSCWLTHKHSGLLMYKNDATPKIISRYECLHMTDGTVDAYYHIP